MFNAMIVKCTNFRKNPKRAPPLHTGGSKVTGTPCLSACWVIRSISKGIGYLVIRTSISYLLTASQKLSSFLSPTLGRSRPSVNKQIGESGKTSHVAFIYSVTRGFKSGSPPCNFINPIFPPESSEIR